MASINPKTIPGPWIEGSALDFHTISSVPMGIDQYGNTIFDTVRSELGELLFRLKYYGDRSSAPEIIATAVRYLESSCRKFDRIVPIPPSAIRAIQPVIILAQGIGDELGVPVVDCVKAIRPAMHLKNVMDPTRRQELLNGLYQVDPIHTEAGKILLFDDLFRSGSTMNAVTEILISQGKAESVRALTITRTRSNR